jgi:hypothetical protein
MAGRTVILYVIVDEGEVVQKLNGCCCGQRCLPITASGLGAKQKYYWSNSLAGWLSVWMVVLIYPAKRVTEHHIEIRRQGLNGVEHFAHSGINCWKQVLHKLAEQC